MTSVFSAWPSLAESVDFPAAILPHSMCSVAFEVDIGEVSKSGGRSRPDKWNRDEPGPASGPGGEYARLQRRIQRSKSWRPCRLYSACGDPGQRRPRFEDRGFCGSAYLQMALSGRRPDT